MSCCGSVVVVGFLLPFMVRATHGQCQFPEFLQRPKSSHDQASWFWVTETKYQLASSDLESQLEVHVTGADLVVKLRFKDRCRAFTSSEPCYEKEIAYKRKCLSKNKDGIYRTMHFEGGHLSGSADIVCMKFEQRNINVIQVFQGPREEEFGAGDCMKSMLQRNEWPWIASVQREWSFCPLVGGFDFRASLSKSNELCPDEWRPSRFESECVQGESMSFLFPSSHCSPFTDKRLETTLTCWANWEENGFLFIVASFPETHPQFVLRLQSGPIDPVSARITWYFSPICPITKRGVPNDGITFPLTILDLTTNQSESGLCYDDSAQCSEFAKAGRCVNTALYQYANYCKRSCGLCNLLPSSRSECRFPIEYQGRWYFLESDRKERVTISPENISFSVLGNFICKSKHWSINYYKLFSVYTNGCRPRYTCLHLEQDNDDVLRFQISSSSSVDQSFDLCLFKDDHLPLGNRIHSLQMKFLISDRKVHGDTCGLHGVMPVSSQLDGERRSCSGYMTDWNERMCGSGARLRLNLSGKCFYTENATSLAAVQQEYTCSSYIELDNKHTLLVTKTSTSPETFVCWAIKTNPSRPSYAPWREVYLLATAQCGTIRDFERTTLDKSRIALFAEGDRVIRPCTTTLAANNRLKPTASNMEKSEEGQRNGETGSEDYYRTRNNDARTDKLFKKPQNVRSSTRSLGSLVGLLQWQNFVTLVAILYKSSLLIR